MAGKSQRTEDQCRTPAVFSQLPLPTRYLVQEGTGAATGALLYIYSKVQDNLIRQEIRTSGFFIWLPWQLMEVTGPLPFGLEVRQIVREDEWHQLSLRTTFQLKRSSCQRLMWFQHAYYGVGRTLRLGRVFISSRIRTLFRRKLSVGLVNKKAIL